MIELRITFHCVDDDLVPLLVIGPHCQEPADTHGVDPHELCPFDHACRVAVRLVQESNPFSPLMRHMGMRIDHENILQRFALFCSVNARMIADEYDF